MTLVFLGITLMLGMFLLIRKIAVRADEAAMEREADRYGRKITDLLLRDLSEEQDRKEVRARLWRRVHAGDISAMNAELSAGPFWRRRERRKAVWLVLEKIGRDVSGGVTERVTNLFEQLGFVEEAIGQLHSGRWWKRARACRRLGFMRSQGALFPLVGLLQDPEEGVREAAADALIDTIGAERAIGPILQNVRAVSDWFSIKLSASILAAGLPALEHLIGTLDSPYSSLRVFAARMLGELRDPAALPALMDRLPKMDHVMKMEALRSLGKIGDQRVYRVLTRYLADSRAQMRIAAVEALGFLGSPEVVWRLEALLLSDELMVRRSAAAVLARLEGPGKNVLQNLASRKDPLVRSLVEEVLDAA